jgi:hypothetical protein
LTITITSLRGYFDTIHAYTNNRAEWEKGLRNLRAWLKVSREEWEAPKQRVIILQGHPAIGEPPEDILWIDALKDLY